ncbi:hypothetical protein EGW08_019024 [Elysia chlorotica]|uniref:Uncharacterized protein n=1 Tax=Elysia chlorotica TaxID=188477 RepID=A0A3S1H6H4_ELYCH|nr:hypothetical protein EGW08_019024 [Elysia chlorotica]
MTPLQTSLTLVVVLLAISVQPAVSTDLTQSNPQFGDSLDFSCPKGQVLSGLRSTYNHTQEERQWTFSCKPAPQDANPLDCRWNQNLCLSNSAMTSVFSFYSEVIKSRAIMFECCTEAGYKTSNCLFTPEQNEWYGDLDYTLPAGYVILGWFRSTDNNIKDVRSKFLVCLFLKE